MTEDSQPSPSPSPSASASPLFTEAELLSQLAEEISRSSQVEVARRYKINPTQLNDILHGRGALSKGALGKLRWELIRLYRKLPEG